MIKWSCTEFNGNTNELYNQYFCIIVATLKNSHQIVYLLTLDLRHSNELLTMPNSRLIRTRGRLVEKKMILLVPQDDLSLKNDVYILI